jgi:hypothetical protein
MSAGAGQLGLLQGNVLGGLIWVPVGGDVRRGLLLLLFELSSCALPPALFSSSSIPQLSLLHLLRALVAANVLSPWLFLSNPRSDYTIAVCGARAPTHSSHGGARAYTDTRP